MSPTLFLSHGPPMMAIEPSPARDFMSELGSALGRPDAILVASAHWEMERLELNAAAVNTTIHDFYGFRPRGTPFGILHRAPRNSLSAWQSC